MATEKIDVVAVMGVGGAFLNASHNGERDLDAHRVLHVEVDESDRGMLLGRAHFARWSLHDLPLAMPGGAAYRHGASYGPAEHHLAARWMLKRDPRRLTRSGG